MKFGFRSSEGSHQFKNALNEAVYAESMGFDSVWMAEHHGWDDFWPTSYIALAGIATRTETIRLGTSVILLPQKNPVRLAAEANLLDVISNGRFILGLGVGWRQAEMENLGYSFEDRGPRMTDYLRAMNVLWDKDSADYDGREISFEGFTLTPKPIQKPHPPVWIGGGVDPQLKRAANLANGWFPVWSHSIEELEERYEVYQDYILEADGDPKEREWPILRLAWIDEDRDAARRNIRAVLKNIAQHYQANDLKLDPEMERALGDEDEFDRYATDRFVFGTPEQCINTIERYEDRLGVDNMVLKFYNPGVTHSQMMSFIGLFGEQVIPHFNR